MAENRISGGLIMGYIEDNLMKDEKIVAGAEVHWMDLAMGILFFWFFFIPLLSAISRRFSTELAVTTHRAIGKQGLVRRHATDLMLDKVQNVTVDQSILGRIFDYGSVRVTTAGESTIFAGIAEPGVFKKAVTNQMEAYGQAKMQQQAEEIAKRMRKDE